MRTAFAVLAAVGLVCCTDAYADQQTASAGTVSVRADRIEAGTVRAFKGNVELSWPGFHLRADSVELRQDPSGREGPIEIVAEGNVELSRGGNRLLADRLTLNLKTGVGTFQLPPEKN